MKDCGIVEGSKAMAQPLVIGYDTIYVHDNINQMQDEEGNLIDNLYEYNEIQYGKDEDTTHLANENEKIRENSVPISELDMAYQKGVNKA